MCSNNDNKNNNNRKKLLNSVYYPFAKINSTEHTSWYVSAHKMLLINLRSQLRNDLLKLLQYCQIDLLLSYFEIANNFVRSFLNHYVNIIIKSK